MEEGLAHGVLGASCVHLCIDMQRMFAPGGPWEVPWAEKVLPTIEVLCARHPERTVFTRFVPAQNPGEGRGMWARYYRRWADVTLAHMDPALVDVIPSLAAFAPPARMLDKRMYSPWTEGALDALLNGSGINTLVITGGETEICVLATVLGAVDRGYRVIVVTDAVCSSADQTHDAIMNVYRARFSAQIETATMQEILDIWA